jgi:hyperosmotically inducible periplasmic protein
MPQNAEAATDIYSTAYANVQITLRMRRRLSPPPWRTDNTSRTGFIDMFPNKGLMMNTKYIIAGLTLCAFLGSVVALADEDSDKDRSHPGAFVKDSAITTKIKTKLAAEHLTNMGRIHVDTDKDGVVWLSGSARTQDAIEEAVSIARSTEHVKSVRNDLIIRKED